jgi:hypothetical protein
MRGSCLCGAVAWEATSPLEALHHCHCSRCRKHHGAPFSTFGQFKREGFRFTRGADRVKSFQSSEQIERTFCSDCGSSLEFRVGFLPDLIWLSAGSFDEDPPIKPDAHIFATSKASWFDITDDLPQHEGYAPIP